jgi:ribosome recycling factor
MIVLNVWDKSMVGATEKAISNSGLGVNPIVDGPLIRIPIPELNEERRRELAKVAGQYAEKARIAIRNVRRGGMDQVKKAKADGLSEDEQKKVSEQIQSLTDRHVKNVDDAASAKEAEIMQV